MLKCWKIEERAMKKIFALIGLSVCLLNPVTASAEYPEKVVRMVVPFAPGGVTDIAARVIGQKLSEQWKQQVIVENRPGAGGAIGVDQAVRSPADGYTLLMATNGEFTINPAVYAKLPYDPQKDVAPIIMVTSTPLMWVANANAPINSIAELIAAAKAKPGTIAYSSPGVGTMNHLTGEWFALATGTKFLHVAYRGGAPAATAIAGGEVPVGVVAISSGLPYIQGGKMKVLGLTTAKRSPRQPDWPTAAEAGVKDFDASIWVGLFAPAGTPLAILTKIENDVRQILKDPSVIERLAAIGAEPVGMPSGELKERIKLDAERFMKIAKEADIRID
jgi:tripartite-type tricarboxylate transporter receptor subunit TctC